MRPLVVLGLCLLLAETGVSSSLVFVQFSGDNYQTTQENLAELESRGVTVRHVFAPNQAIVDIHGMSSGQLADNAKRWTILTETDARAARNGPEGGYAFDAYCNLVNPMAEGRSGNGVISGDWRRSDADSSGGSTGTRTSLMDKLESQYLIGSITVGIYLLESTGSQENWWPEAKQQTFSEIVEGLDWLAVEGFKRGAKVVWVYPPMETISTSQEPISTVSMPYRNLLGWHFDWLNVLSSHRTANRLSGTAPMDSLINCDGVTRPIGRPKSWSSWIRTMPITCSQTVSSHMSSRMAILRPHLS